MPVNEEGQGFFSKEDCSWLGVKVFSYKLTKNEIWSIVQGRMQQDDQPDIDWVATLDWEAR